MCMCSPRFWEIHIWTFRPFKEHAIIMRLSKRGFCPQRKGPGSNGHLYLLWVTPGNARKPLVIPYHFLNSQKNRWGYVGAKIQAQWSRNNFGRPSHIWKCDENVVTSLVSHLPLSHTSQNSLKALSYHINHSHTPQYTYQQ